MFSLRRLNSVSRLPMYLADSSVWSRRSDRMASCLLLLTMCVAWEPSLCRHGRLR